MSENKKNILVVHPYEDTRKLIGIILEREGYNVSYTDDPVGADKEGIGLIVMAVPVPITTWPVNSLTLNIRLNIKHDSRYEGPILGVFNPRGVSDPNLVSEAGYDEILSEIFGYDTLVMKVESLLYQD
jgi:DNA-binding response OmpR family regulator